MSTESILSTSPETTAFDNEHYLEMQLDAFQCRINSMPDADLVIEFGGKPFGDYHASRVLPGYDPNNKATIIRGLQEDFNSKITMVVNARDIFHPPEGRTLSGRVRGDSGLRYDDETIRIVREAKEEHGIDIESVVIAVMPRAMGKNNSDIAKRFADRLYDSTGSAPKFCHDIPYYPDVICMDEERLNEIFIYNDTVADPGRNLVLLSPGGGSGKFGVAISEVYKKLVVGEPVGFAKFETFPIFGLTSDNPVNLAFLAATADLGNRLVNLDNGTNYDKDTENFALLMELAKRLPSKADYISRMGSQFDFSVNVIEAGITDERVVMRAACREIIRRLHRYRLEYANGKEKLSTVQVTARLAEQSLEYLLNVPEL